MGGYAPTNSIGPPAVQRNPEVMGFPVSQERREPRALALLLPLRRQGEVGRGCPRFGLIRKTPLPNPSGHRTQLDGVRQAASQWLASGLPYPLPSPGREQSSRIPPLLQRVRRLGLALLSPPRSHASQHAVAPDQALKQRRRQVKQDRGEQ